MDTVWKFPLVLTEGPQKVRVPATAQVLHVALQAGQPCLWIQLDKSAVTIDRHFFIVGTGHEIAKKSVHHGTWQDGPWVWHLFEAKLS